jgi:hypothetical protein
MVSFEEAAGVLTVRRDASRGMVALIGVMSAFFLLVGSLLLLVSLASPSEVTVLCDRAAARCTFSPGSFLWRPEVLTFDQVRTVRVARRSPPTVYAGDNQLSNGAGDRASMEKAVTALNAFPDGSEPSLSVAFRQHGEIGNWANIVLCLLFGGWWARAWMKGARSVVLRLDKNTGKATATFVRNSGKTEVKEAPLASFRSVETAGATVRSQMVRVGLNSESGEALPLMSQGAFAAAKAEAQQLARRISEFLGVPVVGS